MIINGNGMEKYFIKLFLSAVRNILRLRPLQIIYMVSLTTVVNFETYRLYWRQIYIFSSVLEYPYYFFPFVSKNMKIELHRTINLPVVLHRCELGLSLSLLISWS
jgi:hypothetical protein